MFLKRLAMIGLLFGAGVATSACTDGYGYSGVGVGYGANSYYGDGYGGYGGYGDPYGGYGNAGYGSYFGWYGDYYYPGTGIYVYDQYRRPFRWNNGQRRYWEGRRNTWRGDRNFRNDWNGFDRNRGRGFQGNGVPGQRWDGNRGDRGNRGDWRGDRPTITGQPNAMPRAANPGGQRGWGGHREEHGGHRNGGGRGRR